VKHLGSMTPRKYAFSFLSISYSRPLSLKKRQKLQSMCG